MLSLFLLDGITYIRGKGMISVNDHKLHLNITIPLPCKYRGGGTAVFRIKDDKPEVLLGLRANNPGRGLWSFPGGCAEGKEKLSSAAIREFKEETGVQLYGRYVTRSGIFRIRNFLFEWNTVLIETTQDINIGKRFYAENKTSETRYYGGEFISMRWVPLSDIADLKLHRWVKDVINFYINGKMEPYVATPPRNNIKALPAPKTTNRINKRKSTGESLLFDMAEMVLTKVSRDGTKYYQPAYQVTKRYSPIQEALYGV